MFYPMPPHLTVAIYPGQPEEECFSALCQLVEEFGCTPNGAIELAPWDASFEMRSDLAGRSLVIDAKPDQFARTVAGEDSAGRAIRAQYHSKKMGLILVEYLAATKGDRHPVAISVSARGLGTPIELWRKAERSSAIKLAQCTTTLLREATDRCSVLYGAVGVEFSLATPSELIDGSASLPTEIFVDRDVITSNRELAQYLSNAFHDGFISEWPAGWFHSGWAPFNPENATLNLDKALVRRTGIALGRATLYR